jgi:hypothetical protein
MTMTKQEFQDSVEFILNNYYPECRTNRNLKKWIKDIEPFDSKLAQLMSANLQSIKDIYTYLTKVTYKG